VLETITQDSARMILTGQAQLGSYSQANFETYVCSQVPALFDCSQIWVDVESFPSFADVTIGSPVDAGGDFVAKQYSPGIGGAIVVVRLGYKWPIFVTGLGYNISNLPGSKRLLTASAAFKNEPF
jgi:hypothetical protein